MKKQDDKCFDLKKLLLKTKNFILCADKIYSMPDHERFIKSSGNARKFRRLKNELLLMLDGKERKGD